MYKAQVLADSIYNDTRLITVEVTFPRFILAEVNTHRVFSRNSASSRAIPPELSILAVDEMAFAPAVWGKRVKGMGQGKPLSLEDQSKAYDIWFDARDDMLFAVEALLELGINKSHANRLLETFKWQTAIISGTKWDNFFSLRAPSGPEVDYDFPAQPELQQTAITMRAAMKESHPIELREGQWHLPLIPSGEEAPWNSSAGLKTPEEMRLYWPFVSAGRCAKVSYETQGKPESPDVSFDRATKLGENGHLSPFEHVARPAKEWSEGAGNFGPHWVALRQEIPHEEQRLFVLENREPWYLEG